MKKLANQILARRATTVFGPSGAGKSSLMQAGVIPTLQEAQDARVVSIDAWPVQTPPLVWLVNQIYLDYDLGQVPEGKTLLGALQNAIDLAWRQNDSPMLVVLDQVEQLFVNEREIADMDAWLQGLSWLTDARRSEDVHVVFSLREDYLGRLRDITRERPELSMHGFRVAPLSVGEMAPAMCRTAKEGDPPQIWDADGLRALMLDVRVPGQRATDAAEVQTAFGQIVCRALWEAQQGGQTVELKSVNAEMILRRYFDATLAELGPLRDAAQQLLEEHLIDPEGHRTLLTDREAHGVLGESAHEILAQLEKSAILRAEEHQGSRYFELGHDWLAKKVLERRVSRKKSETEVKRRQDEAKLQAEARRVLRRSRSVLVIAGCIVMGVVSGGTLQWMFRQIALTMGEVAKVAESKAEAKAKEAVRASTMAGVRELVATGKPGPAALVLMEVDVPENARGWPQLAADLISRQIPMSTRVHNNAVGNVAWSPDGKRLLTSAGNVAHIWRADARGDAILLTGHEKTIASIDWSPDGTRVVTASADQTVRVWPADGKGEPLVLRGHTDEVILAAFSHDGASIVSASNDQTARVWRADGTGEQVVLRGHDENWRSIAWSPDDTRIAAASTHQTAHIWSADGSGKPLVLEGHTGTVLFVGWSPDGTRLATTSYDNTARIWSADGKGEPIVLAGHEHAVTAAKWNHDGTRVMTVSMDKTARLWRADGQGEPILLRGHDGAVISGNWSPDDDYVITTSLDKSARVWRADGSSDGFLLEHGDAVWAGEWSPDGKHIATVSLDGTMRVWRMMGDVLRLQHPGSVNSVAWSPDGKRIATASSDNDVRVWSANGEGKPVVIGRHEAPVNSIAWSPDGRRIVTASRDNTARVWAEDGKTDPVVLRGHEGWVFSAAWSPDGQRVVTTSWDHTARIWAATGVGEPVVLRGHDGWVFSAAWSPDGQRIVTTSWDHTARVWAATGVGEPVVLEGHDNHVNFAGWSPDSRRIVTASSDETARIWSADGQGKAIVLRGHNEPLTFAGWSPDGRHIVTTSWDMTARIWRVDDQAEVLLLRSSAWVNGAAWSPDGQRIVTGSNDRTARIWPFTIPLLQQALRNVTTDCLTSMQRQTYLLETESEARMRYEACERRYERTPLGKQ